MNTLLNSHKIFVYKGNLYDLKARITNFDLIKADTISVTDSDQGLYGSYSIFHPSSVDAFIVDQGNLHDEYFRQGILAYHYIEDISLHRIFNSKALPITQRPSVIIVTTDTEWITSELNEIIQIIQKSDLPPIQ